MNTDSIAMTTRDQIALDIYIRLATDHGRNRISYKDDARCAYNYADAFLIEQKVQASTTESLTPPPAPPALENHNTVPPKVGHRFYMRNGQIILIEPITREHTSYHLPNGKHNLDPQFDLVSECPF